MAAYAYQQNFYEGASAGYVKFNTSPELGTPVAPGEQIIFEGQVYSKNYAVAGMELAVYNADFSEHIYPDAKFAVSAKKGTATAFRITFTMPGAADWFPEGRTVPLAFKFSVARSDGSGDTLTPTAVQRLLWLRYRIRPEILQAEFYRYGMNDKTSLYERMDDGAYCMCAGLRISLASGYTASDITIARITTSMTRNVVNLSKGVLTTALTADGYAELLEPSIFSGMTFDPGYSFALLVEIGDEFDVAAGSIVLPRSFANMILCNFGTGGVSFGGFPKSTEGNPLFENHYPAHFYAGTSFHGGIANIQAGTVAPMGNTAGGSYRDSEKVLFAKAFAQGTVPVVVVGFRSGSVEGGFGRCCVAVLEADNEGFILRFFNGDGENNRNPDFTYIAFGVPE